MKLSELPNHLNSKIFRDGNFESLGKINHVKQDLLVFLESKEYIQNLEINKGLSGVITKPELGGDIPDSLAVMTADDPRAYFYDLHDYLFAKTNFYGEINETQIHHTAKVHPSAIVPDKGVVIGANSVIEAGAILHAGTITEASSVIRSGAVIGAEGFEFFRNGDAVRAVPHAGGVLLKVNSEVQSGAVIEKSVYGGNTVIGINTKIGSNSLIAHNTTIGNSCLLAGGVTVSGNVVVEEGSWIGPGATISNGITIHANAHIALGSIVVRSVLPRKSVSGVFAADKHSVMKFMAKSGLIK